MKYRTADRLQIVFLIIFVVICVALFFMHGPGVPGMMAPAKPSAATLKDPKARCEAMGDWWDAQDRQCAVPMPISHFTGRAAKP